MTIPSMFIVSVSDIPASTRFYADLFDVKPSLDTPGFVSFDLTEETQLALWKREVPAEPSSEMGVVLDGSAQVDRQFQEWQRLSVRVVEEPHDAPFGRTFVVADPDGNLIRVAPRY